MLLETRKIEGSEVTVVHYKDYDSISLSDVLVLFNEFKEKGTIQNESFYDPTWRLFNFTGSFPISLEFNEVMFETETRERNIGSLNDLVFAIKTMILYRLNVTSISTLYEFTSALKSILHATSFFRTDRLIELNNIKSVVRDLDFVLDFADFYYPLDIDKKYIEKMSYLYELYVENRAKNRARNQRNIGNFDSVFRFNEIMDRFWIKADNNQREKYYPIKLWWEITTKIPLRTTELTVTPYDCTSFVNNKYYLTVRRTNLKGESGNKVVTHTVEGDYQLQTIRINKELYDLIQNYKSLVDRYDTIPHFYGGNDDGIKSREFLFSYRSYFNFVSSDLTKKSIIKSSTTKDYFSSRTIAYLLDKFFFEIAQDQFGYQIVPKLEGDVDLEDNQVELLQPMDTRHHAFINMVLNDIEPLFVKKIGGHDSIESSSHYFAHVDKFVKCFTYSMARRLANKENYVKETTELEYLEGTQRNKLMNHDTKKYRDVDGGRCYSQQPLTDLRDCRKVNNECLLCFKFFEPNNIEEGLQELVKVNEDLITRESEVLNRLVQNYRKVKNFDEEFMQKVNSIKGYANQNAHLRSRLLVKGGTNGEEK